MVRSITALLLLLDTAGGHGSAAPLATHTFMLLSHEYKVGFKIPNIPVSKIV